MKKEGTPERLFDLFPAWEQRYRYRDDVLVSKENGKWIKYDLIQCRQRIDDISYALMQLGVKRNDKIAIIGRSCPDWNFVDFATLQLGAVVVPIYTTIGETDLEHILQHSEVKYVFISGRDVYRRIEATLKKTSNIKETFSFKAFEGIRSLDELIAATNQRDEQALEQAKAAVDKHDVATIIYTSGTTGTPKGVMLSHDNILKDVEGASAMVELNDHTTALSFLPLSHILERQNIYSYLNSGTSTYYAENPGTIIDNIREVNPDLMISVPRVIEKIYYKLEIQGRKLTGLKKSMFFWAIRLAERYDETGHNGLIYSIKYFFADKLVYSKWRAIFGKHMKYIVTGGAPIQPRLVKLFCAMQIPVVEGYGLTETSPVVAVNSVLRPGYIKAGTVGKVMEGQEVKIGDEGEVLVKGPNVMLGYFKDPDLTRNVIDADGWFHTGDKGIIEKDGFLKITGRIKDIFKTSMGKFVSPALIENKFLESPFFSNLMVIGEAKKFAAALIIPNFEHLRSWCKIKEIAYTTDAEMVHNKIVAMRFRKEVDKYNKFFGDFEQIKKFEILGHEWTIESGEITASLKKRRSHIMERYQDIIDRIYAE